MFDRISRIGSDVMPSGLVGRIGRLDRRIGLAVMAVVPLLLFGGVAWFLLRGDDGNGVDDAPPPNVVFVDSSGGVPLIPDGVPLVSMEDVVAESVSATIAAMPTATPEPTPDVAATLQAQLAFNRQMSPGVLKPDPLDSDGPRNPYLSKEELTYFRELGPRLWIYTQVWFHVRRVVSVEVSEWDAAVFGYDLERAEALLESFPDRVGYSSMGEVGPVVRSYADSIEAGMSGVDQAVVHLAEARSILEGEEFGPLERGRLIRLSREVEYLLDEFDSAMSVYGCSVCGELFREVGK